jgi:hypothetical protein
MLSKYIHKHLHAYIHAFIHIYTHAYLHTISSHGHRTTSLRTTCPFPLEILVHKEQIEAPVSRISGNGNASCEQARKRLRAPPSPFFENVSTMQCSVWKSGWHCFPQRCSNVSQTGGDFWRLWEFLCILCTVFEINAYRGIVSFHLSVWCKSGSTKGFWQFLFYFTNV